MIKADPRGLKWAGALVNAGLLVGLGVLLFARADAYSDTMKAGRSMLIADAPGQEAASRPELAASGLRAALAADPLNARIANAAMVAAHGDAQGAAASLARDAAVVARLGWRDTTALQNQLTLAVERRDVPRVLDLLDALLRRRQIMDQAMMAMTAVEVDPDARAQLALRLKANPSWREPYLRDMRLLRLPQQVAARYETTRALMRDGVHLERSEIAPLTIRMVQAGMVRQADDLWRTYSRVAPALIADGDFSRFVAHGVATDWQVPFEWRAASGAGFSVAGFRDGDAARVRIDWDRRGAPVFLDQQTGLTPGRYSLRVVATEGANIVPGLFDFALECGGTRYQFGSAAVQSTAVRLGLDRPLACANPRFVIGGKPQTGAARRDDALGIGDSQSSVVLDSVQLVRIGDG